jgi:hypothetical protein
MLLQQRCFPLRKIFLRKKAYVAVPVTVARCSNCRQSRAVATGAGTHLYEVRNHEGRKAPTKDKPGINIHIFKFFIDVQEH